MRQSALTERSAAHSPPASAAWKTQFHRVRRFAFETGLKTKLRRSKAQEPFARPGEKSLTRAIHEAQLPVVVKGEDGYVNFFHHGAQQPGSFHRSQSLRTKRLTQGVDFQHDFAERVIGACFASAKGEILFAHRGKQIR